MTLGDSAHAGEPSRSTSNDDLERELGRTKLPRERADSGGLLDSQYAILRLLDDTDGASELSMSRLAEAMALDPSTMSRQVQNAERHGLVARRTSADDARVKALTATPDGCRRLEAAKDYRCGLLQNATSGWSARELGEFIALLRRFNRAAGT